MIQENNDVAALRGTLREAAKNVSLPHYFMACLLEAARVGKLLVATPTEAGFLDNASECWRIPLCQRERDSAPHGV